MLHSLLPTWFKWTIIYTEGRADEHHSLRASSVLEAMMDRVLKVRHWKHDLLQANVALWVHTARNYSYRDGSCNRGTRGSSTQATPRALHAFQFPQNVLISSSTSPIATVEIIHFRVEIAADRDEATFACRNPLMMSIQGFGLKSSAKFQIKSPIFGNFFDHPAEDLHSR